MPNKKIILWVLLLVAIVLVGAFSYYFFTGKLSGYQTGLGWQSKHPYINSTYGFSVDIPKSWDSYFVREERGEYGEIEVVISLPLKSPILKESVSFFEKEHGIFDLWRVYVFSPPLYEAYGNPCENVPADSLCFSLTLVGQNSHYVITEGQPWVPGGGWAPCADEAVAKEDPDLCHRLEDARNTHDHDSVKLLP